MTDELILHRLSQLGLCTITTSLNSGKIHGNSLDYPGTNYGYVLVDKTTGEIVKYGESINPDTRYTQSFLNGENPIKKPVAMEVVTSGTKAEVHLWQHQKIVDFYETVGELPKLSNSEW